MKNLLQDNAVIHYQFTWGQTYTLLFYTFYRQSVLSFIITPLRVLIQKSEGILIPLKEVITPIGINMYLYVNVFQLEIMFCNACAKSVYVIFLQKG